MKRSAKNIQKITLSSQEVAELLVIALDLELGQGVVAKIKWPKYDDDGPDFVSDIVLTIEKELE
jgi:hypothetical protein